MEYIERIIDFSNKCAFYDTYVYFATQALKALKVFGIIKRKGTSSETFAYIGFSGSASVKDIGGNPTKYSKVISILEDDDSPAKKEFFEMKNLYYRLKSNYEHANDLDDDDF